MTYRMEDGWRKVNQKGGSYVVATLYNVKTGEDASLCVRDYDYSDGSRDCEEWYQASIDEAAKTAYFRKHGIIYPGASVVVVKGRKIPLGTVAVVESLRAVTDRFGRWVADYAVFKDGKQTKVENLALVLPVEGREETA